jgi:DNA-nicking Smr family endonuclease
MSRGGGKSDKGGRTIAADEAELWNKVARSVDKVKGKPRVSSHSVITHSTPPVPEPPAPAKSEPKPLAKHASKTAPSVSKARPAPLGEFDRRTARQVASGKIGIDARLDLHGMRQSDARAELRAFLRAAQARGSRTVLVITGKGDAADDKDHLARALGEPQRGVLRRSVPQWLEEPDLRTVVLSYTGAGPRHGGDGAFYVQLRKPKQN